MNISFFEFISAAFENPAMMIAVLLTLGVIFVNGWTDAPNAIMSPVCSGALTMKHAVILAAVCNFAGTLLMIAISSKVAENVFACADLSDTGAGHAALCAALLSVILLAVGAWCFGIPTSESHAMIASLIGAALACGGRISVQVLVYTLIGLVLSVLGGFAAGYGLYVWIERKDLSRRRLRQAQIGGAALMSLMHGAQDGQKFISVFATAVIIAGGGGSFYAPVWAVLLCSVVMASGTALGGGRIIRKVGKNMVDLNDKQGVCADLAGGISLLCSTLLGLPVSTTHAKTSSVMGCGYVEHALNTRCAFEMIAAWVITFPSCLIMGYLLTKLFMV